jgi:hypothetical protein
MFRQALSIRHGTTELLNHRLLGPPVGPKTEQSAECLCSLDLLEQQLWVCVEPSAHQPQQQCSTVSLDHHLRYYEQ